MAFQGKQLHKNRQSPVYGRSLTARHLSQKIEENWTKSISQAWVPPRSAPPPPRFSIFFGAHRALGVHGVQEKRQDGAAPAPVRAEGHGVAAPRIRFDRSKKEETLFVSRPRGVAGHRWPFGKIDVP